MPKVDAIPARRPPDSVLALFVAVLFTLRGFVLDGDILLGDQSVSLQRAALQAAFLAVHRDPQFLADAAKLKIEVDALGAAPVLAAIDRIADAPRDLLDHLRMLLAGQGRDAPR